MKKTLLFLAISTLFLFTSCSDDDDSNQGNDKGTTGSISGIDLGVKALYILNEGAWDGNNATLTFLERTENIKEYYVVDSITNDSIFVRDTIIENIITNDYFTKKNSRGLGDVANDMKLYGGKIYIVVNNSNTIEIVNATTGISLKQIPCNNAMPRQVVFDGGYAYVSCHNGDIMRIDTVSMNVTSTMKVSGSNPDGIAVYNGKLYVANTGGLNFPNYDSTLSVINLGSFTEEEKITVGINPGQVLALGNDKVLIAVTGNYDDITPSLKIMNTKTNTVEKTIDIQSSRFTLYNNMLYSYYYDYTTQKMSFARYDIKNDRIDNSSFIKDASKIKSPYGIAINEANGDIYIVDAVDTQGTNGTLYCFNSNGSLKFEFETGVLPSKIVFIR